VGSAPRPARCEVGLVTNILATALRTRIRVVAPRPMATATDISMDTDTLSGMAIHRMATDTLATALRTPMMVVEINAFGAW
jgi:hypothetical protein